MDLLNKEQPFFALAGTALDEATCAGLLAPLMVRNQPEAKYARLKNSHRGRTALLEFFSSDRIDISNTKLLVVDKLFYLITHIVDKLIEPPLHEAGIDLYAADAHVGLVNVWYHAGPTIFPHGHWERILVAFVDAIRQRTRASYRAFDTELTRGAALASPTDHDFVTGLMLARGRLSELTGVFDRLSAFDPAVDIFISMVNKWMADFGGMLRITHDRSKPLKHNEAFLRTMMTPLAKRTIGYGARQAELPLRVEQFDFAESQNHPQLQLADIVAGAAVDCSMAWTGKRPTSEYHEAMRSSKLLHLIADAMWPSLDMTRKNEPLPGQVNLVDGSVQFMKEAAARNT